MIHAFNIYPALLIITSAMQEQPIEVNHRPGNSKASDDKNENFKTWPQTFWGDCLFNESHTQLVLRFETDSKTVPLQEILDAKLELLQPVKFKGKRYAITYIPVLN